MAETIGQQLKQAREAKALTIQKVVQATHIRAYQIEAIEADDFESLPSPVQARAYLHLYAEYLGLSVDEMIARQRIHGNEPSAAVNRPPNAVETPVPTAESASGSTPVENKTAGSKLIRLPARKKQGVPHPEKQSMPIEAIEPIPATPTTPAPNPNEQEVTSNGTVTQPAPEENQTAGGKKNGLFTGIKKIFIRPKLPSMPMEPVETSNLIEPFDIDNEEPVSHPEETPAPAPDVLPSQLLFISIGKTLRQRRESLSLTLDEIERQTHVRKHYLEALEAGMFDCLPSSVQARGMLNNYTHFLDLDVDALLLTFAEGLQTQRLERQPKLNETPQKATSENKTSTSRHFKIKIPAAIRRYFSVDIFVGGGLVLLLLTFAIWGTSRVINLRAGSTPQPTAPSISNILVSTPEVGSASPTPTTTGNGASTVVPMAGETLVLTLPAAGNGAVQVVVIAQEQALVIVTVDGKVQFDGRVTAGAAYPFDGNTQIEVRTGNGGAISILYNQNNLGPMGNLGEVVDHIYTANAILNPTATFTPTPTITQTPTLTLRPSTTPRPSSTPRPSATPIQ